MSEPIFSHDQSIEISAAPEAVYALISAMDRYGEWSPQNVGGSWLDGATGKVGDWFEGNNKAGKAEWSAKVEITEATPGQEFGFWTLGKAAQVAHWRYSLAASGSGTTLTEHYRLHNPPAQIAKGGEEAVKGWCEGVKANISTTLDNLKRVAEG